jgi:hypothetical protein
LSPLREVTTVTPLAQARSASLKASWSIAIVWLKGGKG